MNDSKTKHTMLLSVFTALFAALIAVSGFIAVPLPGSPVPIVLQNMMPILAAALLGGIQGAGAAGLFLLAGIAGLPVFSGGHSGMAGMSPAPRATALPGTSTNCRSTRETPPGSGVSCMN